MPLQLTIIGLGQIGASAGLALAEHKDLIKRVGHDKEPGAAQKAQRLGAVDQIHYNLPAAVRDADIVLLALPLNAVRETFEYISQDLKENTVVLDTTPVKLPVAAWARELLPEKRYYVGLVPAINPAYLHERAFGADAAHADLFKNGLIGIASPPGTPGEAIKLAADLAQLLGAQPLFIDPAESDGLMARVHLLPQLLSVALIACTVNEPGWAEARKLAGRAFASVAGPLLYQDRAPALRDAALLNRENVLRLLDGITAHLQGLRNDIAAGAGESLTSKLAAAYDGQLKWQNERDSVAWRPSLPKKMDLPSAGQALAQMFLGSKLLERRKKKE